MYIIPYNYHNYYNCIQFISERKEAFYWTKEREPLRFGLWLFIIKLSTGLKTWLPQRQESAGRPKWQYVTLPQVISDWLKERGLQPIAGKNWDRQSLVFLAGVGLEEREKRGEEKTHEFGVKKTQPWGQLEFRAAQDYCKSKGCVCVFYLGTKWSKAG